MKMEKFNSSPLPKNTNEKCFYFNCSAVNVALAKAESNRGDIATAP
ncbi:hypothetical protein J7E50_24860 [Pedobacter sp. ISL-68]|nr:hypothetical protein [Pedobacter sp. ISL-64]MBT2563138.1 hypothetical protein [Pedobacter sp. ISL-64]MBT2593476.1 hypothetical protein [Pedobacter sp. ISL-68]